MYKNKANTAQHIIPIPNPQSLIPNPQSPIPFIIGRFSLLDKIN
ncbi:hypothetical protein FDUTEX481_00403 [Tolypothrix sp. PCC 7601]|nr:hypothetical protein FDUTEX481_00403 [Tolypothrix sp. PCC 7601]